MALPESQASLGCPAKGALYDYAMHIGKRIKLARERLDPRPTQADIGALFGISDKAVSGWEREDSEPEPDKYAALRRKLRVTFAYLLLGSGTPPDPNDPMVQWEDRLQDEYEAAGERGRQPATPQKARRR